MAFFNFSGRVTFYYTNQKQCSLAIYFIITLKLLTLNLELHGRRTRQDSCSKSEKVQDRSVFPWPIETKVHSARSRNCQRTRKTGRQLEKNEKKLSWKSWSKIPVPRTLQIGLSHISLFRAYFPQFLLFLWLIFSVFFDKMSERLKIIIFLTIPSPPKKIWKISIYVLQSWDLATLGEMNLILKQGACICSSSCVRNCRPSWQIWEYVTWWSNTGCKF